MHIVDTTRFQATLILEISHKISSELAPRRSITRKMPHGFSQGIEDIADVFTGSRCLLVSPRPAQGVTKVQICRSSTADTHVLSSQARLKRNAAACFFVDQQRQTWIQKATFSHESWQLRRLGLCIDRLHVLTSHTYMGGARTSYDSFRPGR